MQGNQTVLVELNIYQHINIVAHTTSIGVNELCMLYGRAQKDLIINYLAAVLIDEVVLFCTILEEDPPTSYIGAGLEEFKTQPSMDGDILAATYFHANVQLQAIA